MSDKKPAKLFAVFSIIAGLTFFRAMAVFETSRTVDILLLFTSGIATGLAIAQIIQILKSK